MTSRLAARGLLFTMILAGLVLAACAQDAAGYDEEATRARIVAYFETFFPQLSAVQVVEISEEEDSPFVRVDVSFVNRGQQQTQPVYMTADGERLILGQIWDLTKDPRDYQWEQKTEGAEERMSKLDLSGSPYRGNADAKVTVVEFSDYQCPYCSRAYATLEGQLVETYGDRVKFVFKHLPLESLHPWAKKASIAAACAQQQSLDAFWGFHGKLFENQRAITVENLREKVEEFAGELNLEKEPLLACFDSEATAALVENDLREASQIGIGSTPTFLVNGALISGAVPFEEMSSYVERALEDAKEEKEY